MNFEAFLSFLAIFGLFCHLYRGRVTRGSLREANERAWGLHQIIPQLWFHSQPLIGPWALYEYYVDRKKNSIWGTDFWELHSHTKGSWNQFFAFGIICQRVFGVHHMLWDLSWPVRGLHTQNCLCPSMVPPCAMKDGKRTRPFTFNRSSNPCQGPWPINIQS